MAQVAGEGAGDRYGVKAHLSQILYSLNFTEHVYVSHAMIDCEDSVVINPVLMGV